MKNEDVTTEEDSKEEGVAPVLVSSTSMGSQLRNGIKFYWNNLILVPFVVMGFALLVSHLGIVIALPWLITAMLQDVSVVSSAERVIYFLGLLVILLRYLEAQYHTFARLKNPNAYYQIYNTSGRQVVSREDIEISKTHSKKRLGHE